MSNQPPDYSCLLMLLMSTELRSSREDGAHKVRDDIRDGTVHETLVRNQGLYSCRGHNTFERLTPPPSLHLQVCLPMVPDGFAL